MYVEGGGDGGCSKGAGNNEEHLANTRLTLQEQNQLVKSLSVGKRRDKGDI